MMSRHTAQVGAVIAAFVVMHIASASSLDAQQRSARQRVHAAQPPRAKQSRPVKPAEPPPLPCGDIVSFQVLLDHQGFSPGEIADRPTRNLARALRALQAARGLPPTGEPDCDTWHRLGGDTSGPTTTVYTISDDDMNGPFQPKIPRDLVAQATLETLAYRSPIEKLGERFHVSPALLERMNSGIAIAAGREIKVPAVQPFDPDTEPTTDAAAADVTIHVTREESALRVTRADGTLVFFAPVTTGSEHDPLPQGDWAVRGVQWLPAFHYNPQLFWDAKPQDTKVTIKPGPNNPVGVVWIDLTLEHYGLHGTPEPGRIGMTESHGCVRLTNWDAARVTAFVQPGTPVLFR